jgi:hypothetical protein
LVSTGAVGFPAIVPRQSQQLGAAELRVVFLRGEEGQNEEQGHGRPLPRKAGIPPWPAIIGNLIS